MIPYEIDPSLHAAQPMPPQLDDGFSPPSHDEAVGVAVEPPDSHVEPALQAKSLF